MDKIEQKINQIFLSRMSIDFEKDENIRKSMLLGTKLHIPSRELLLIFFDIEKSFSIKVPEQEVQAGSFKSFDKICEMMHRLLPEHNII